MSQRITYFETKQFQKDFRKLLRRFRTLKSDFEVAKRNAIELYYLHGIDNRSIFPIPKFCSEELVICKVKKISCRALKGRGARSGIRIIYAFFPKESRVVFIEMYFKGDKASEDKTRIKQFLKS